MEKTDATETRYELNRLCHAIRENGEARGKLQAELNALQDEESALIKKIHALFNARDAAR